MIAMILGLAMLTIMGVARTHQALPPCNRCRAHRERRSAAIVTNGKMQSGGPYFLISRTLGAELGGAIGILLLFEHVVGAVYYLTTFEEILHRSRIETVSAPAEPACLAPS